MKTENIDIFDDNMIYIGSDTNENAHLKGLWHKTFNCWFLEKIENKNCLIFQQRCSRKKIFPNHLDITVAGHLISGELPIHGIREIKEEIGININKNKLFYVGNRCQTKQISNYIDREYVYTYFHKVTSHYNYILEIKEVDSLVYFEIEDVLKLFSNEIISINPIKIFGEISQLDCFKKNNFVPYPDNYFILIALTALRFFKKEKYIII